MAVREEQQTKFQLWMDKLLTEGYYTDLQKWTERSAELRDLGQELMEVGFHMRGYEDRLTNRRIDDQFKEDLTAKLARIIEGIKKL